MADCSKTEVFLEELHRMCDSIVCSACEYGKSTEPCRALIMDNIDDSMRIVQKWSDEHPLPNPKTYADDFFDKFPHCDKYETHGNVPAVCRVKVYGGDCNNGGKLYSTREDCKECWNEPYTVKEEEF